MVYNYNTIIFYFFFKKKKVIVELISNALFYLFVI